MHGALGSGWCAMSEGEGEITRELLGAKTLNWAKLKRNTSCRDSSDEHDFEAEHRSLSCVQTDPLSTQ